MLDLSDKLKFKSDIEGNHVTAYPLIIIEDSENPIYISTIKETLLESNNSFDPLVFKDYNLKISNIKESMDIKNHSFKISNVTITLNNYEQDGERLSDLLDDKINRNVFTYYKTQSCETLDDCLLLYRGLIRRVEHDDITVKITLEDLTDATFHKDVPIANLGTRRECFSKKYFNKYIPMTYGGVDKAPVIPYIDNIGSMGNYFISIIPDDVDDVTGSNRGLSITGFSVNENSPEMHVFPTDKNGKDNPLHIYKGDYFRVLRNYEKNFHKGSGIEHFREDAVQYEIDTNFLKIEKHYSSGFAQNPPAANQFQTVKLYYPDQAETLKTEVVGQTGDPGDNSSVINVETSIFNPANSYDNNEKPSSFFDGDISGEFDTYSEVPYVDVNVGEDSDEEIKYYVNNFTPVADYEHYGGVHSPAIQPFFDNRHEKYNMGTNYLFHVTRWAWLNAHKLSGKVRFVCLPPVNMIREYAWRMVYKNDLFVNLNDDGTYTGGDFSLKGSDSTTGVRVRHLYKIASRLRHAWANASGFSGDNDGSVYTGRLYNGTWVEDSNEDATLMDWDAGNGTYSEANNGITSSMFIFPSSGTYDYLKPTRVAKSFTANEDEDDEYTYTRYIYFTNKKIIDGSEFGVPCWYPTTLMQVRFDNTHPDNMPNEGNGIGIDSVVIGQWQESTMGSYADNGLVGYSSGTRYYWFVNLFNDGSGIPYMFELDDFAAFTPLSLTSKRWQSGVSNDADNINKMSIVPKYYCQWNGVNINRYGPTGNVIGWGDAYAHNSLYAGGYSYYAGQYANNLSYDQSAPFKEGVSQRSLLAKSIGNSSVGGNAWWMHFTDDVSEDEVMKDLEGTENFGDFQEFFNAPSDTGVPGTKIAKGTLIPMNHRSNAWLGTDNGGQNWGWEPVGHHFTKGSPIYFSTSDQSITIQAGEGTNAAEVRLGILYPFSDISVSDAIPGETNTFAFGKVDLSIMPESEGIAEVNYLDHNSNDKLVVQAYASDTIESNELDFNAEFVGGSSFGTTLIKLNREGSNPEFGEGENEIFTAGGTVLWKSRLDTLEGDMENENNVYKALEDYKISAWDSPDKFDALSLAYRVISDDPQGHAQIKTKIYNIGVLQFSMFENALNDDLYADVQGRANSANDLYAEDPTDPDSIRYKYTNAPFISDEATSAINNPADMIYHMIEKELGQTDIVDREAWEIARGENSDLGIGFSVKDKIYSKKLIQDLCKNTKMYPKFSNNGEFSFKVLKDAYSESDIDMIIKQKDIIKFSFKRTPIEDVVTLANVKYKKDYAKDELTKSTGYTDCHDMFGNGESGTVYREDIHFNQLVQANGDPTKGYSYNSLGISRDSNVLEFESEFIRSYDGAKQLRDYLLMLHCNQHTIIKCTLPLKYISLEVGNIIRFDKLNNNTKAYGEDYTKENVRNGQIIYPYMMITSISKSSKNIQIECFQLHRLERTFQAGLGNLSRKSELGVGSAGLNIEAETGFEMLGGQPIFFDLIGQHFSFEDLRILQDMVIGNVSKATSEQKVNSDINGDASVDINDINQIIIWVSEALGIEASTFETGIVSNEVGEAEAVDSLGDLNLDGTVNVVDIVSLVSYILGTNEPDANQILAADLNQDGVVNVVDIVTIVSLILDA